MAKVFLNSRVLIQEAVAELLSKDYLQQLGAMASDMIRLRTRLGYGVEKPGQPRSKLATLAESTKKERKRLKGKGRLNESTSPNKSNLTRTGQLLSSLGVLSYGKTSVTVGVSGPRNDGKTNEQVARYAAEGSTSDDNPRPKRAFISLTDIEQKRLRETVRKDLAKKLKVSLSKRR